MTDKKKQPHKTAKVIKPRVEQSIALPKEETEPWRKWKVKPDMVYKPAVPPEEGVGARIAYCRGQLDNLSVEALARYTKNFDSAGAGISRTTIVRYESGDNIPGARELRILCDTFWVSANWLLFGHPDAVDQQSTGRELVNVLARFIQERSGSGVADWAQGIPEWKLQKMTEERQKWIHEARNPTKS